MSLILEVEFLTGAYRGTREPAAADPDWPPQSDRVFSALVAAWAARGERDSERHALEWLEGQEPPTVHASAHSARTAPTVYVPPNDDGATIQIKNGKYLYFQVMPEGRRRQPRQFPVARPDEPILAFSWPQEPDAERMRCLESLARDVAYIGHSASLTRCRFLRGSVDSLPGSPARSLRAVYPGRLVELEQAYRTNPVRPTIQPGRSVFPDPTAATPKPDAEWLVLEALEGEFPDLRAAALVCRLTRHALLSGYRRAGMGDAIPEVVSGHTPDGRPTRNPHLAIAPLAFVGSQFADGKVHGLALIPPRDMPIGGIPGFREAFRRVASHDPKRERRILPLGGHLLPERLSLSPVTPATKRRSLSDTPYRRASRIWSTVTPIILDRHLKNRGEAEVRNIIADSCQNAGLPRPDPDRIQTGRHSAFQGAPAARPHRGAPPWTRWRVPESLSSRSKVHAVIDFGQLVEGPVLLGAGRFTGLGLCRGERG